MMNFVSNEPPASFNRQSGAIKTWSFSTLDEFNKCQYRSYLARVKKFKQEQQAEANRGENIHGEFEDYIRGLTDKVTGNMKHKLEEAYKLRERFSTGLIEVEHNWGFDANWGQTGYFDKNVWCRMKLDVMNHETLTSAVITDWKSGKKLGNEMKHTKQLQLYAIGAFLRYPELRLIEGRMEYTDQKSDNSLVRTWTREKAMLLLPSWTNAGTLMTTTTVFHPRPNTSNCRFCPFHPDKGGQCSYGV